MKSLLRAAAERTYQKRLAEYNRLADIEAKDLAQAAAEKRALVNFDWKPRYDAEQKKNAAATVLATIIEEEGKEGL